ncbi:TetR/AcrR family transcriptional regulator [Isoalcanivorax indicus]|uniref:TetR/AcrR family transcriptional regulator n=1 Tax=Isoalcanivorax indicus TaxID=2202653 RepID=UPI0013C412CD|nr:TetR/AcrR family transcriptional regulator [Isoalcanivorax indicus]
MSVRARRAQEKELRRTSILDAAETVFFDKGFERSTMDDIARAAQLSRGLLYVYFRDKSAILGAVILRAGECLRSRFREVADRPLTGAEQIQAMGQAYYLFSREEPDYFDLLTLAASDRPQTGEPEQDDAMEACSGEVMQIMADTLKRGIQDGSLDPRHVRDPFQTALYLRGTLHGIIMLTRQEAGHQVPDAASSEALVAYAMDRIGASLMAH